MLRVSSQWLNRILVRPHAADRKHCQTGDPRRRLGAIGPKRYLARIVAHSATVRAQMHRCTIAPRKRVTTHDGRLWPLHEPTTVTIERSSRDSTHGSHNADIEKESDQSKRAQDPDHSDRIGGAHTMPAMSGPRPVRAPRGTTLTCRAWPTEAALRMLQNNLDPEVAERPDDLVVYGGTGRAARSWDAFDAMLRTLQHARRRRDDARPVGQAGRRVPHPRVGAAGADRQLQPRARLGELGRVPPPRGARAHDVRPDDRRLVDLHRHAGDPPGHVRVLRRDRPPPLRRLAGRHDHADRRARRDGRRPAAGGHDERRRGPVHRRRPERIQRRLETRYLDEVADSVDDAIARCLDARDARARRCRSASSATPPPSCRALLERGLPGRHRHRPDERPRPAQLRAAST